MPPGEVAPVEDAEEGDPVALCGGCGGRGVAQPASVLAAAAQSSDRRDSATR